MTRVCLILTRKTKLSFHNEVFKRQARWLSCLEVERKFVPAADFNKQVGNLVDFSNCKTSNAMWRAEKVLVIRDVYFDVQDQLSSKGIWIRHRTTSTTDGISSASSCWDAKIRLGGDFIESEFEEIHGEHQIRELLSVHLPGIKLESLNVLADLKSMRSGWTIRPANTAGTNDNERLSVILDTVVPAGSQNLERSCPTQFSHRIGEVEISKSIARTPRTTAHEGSKASERCHMRARIHKFMDQHSALFSDAKPIGKLSAYLAWVKENGI